MLTLYATPPEDRASAFETCVRGGIGVSCVHTVALPMAEDLPIPIDLYLLFGQTLRSPFDHLLRFNRARSMPTLFFRARV